MKGLIRMRLLAGDGEETGRWDVVLAPSTKPLQKSGYSNRSSTSASQGTVSTKSVARAAAREQLPAAPTDEQLNQIANLYNQLPAFSKYSWYTTNRLTAWPTECIKALKRIGLRPPWFPRCNSGGRRSGSLPGRFPIPPKPDGLGRLKSRNSSNS